MSPITIIWSVIAGVALVLALIYGLVWLMDRKARASLAFAVEALSVVGSVVVELGMMYSATPAEWGEWVRWSQVPIFLRTVGVLAFIRFYFDAGRSWLLWLIIASRAVILVAGFATDPNFNFARIDSIDRIPFLGEQVTVVGQATFSPHQWFATVAVFLVLVFVADASVTLWRRQTQDARRKVIVIGGAVFLSWILTATITQLMIYGIVRLPAMLSPPGLLVFAAMAFEMSRDSLRASRLAREIEALQRELAHAGRVSVLGTLSSSLAHELSQPLSAILLNCRSADQLLNSSNPDLGELRDMLEDIQRDDRHAVEVINRLRSLLKRRDLDVAPVSMEVVLQETSVLLKSDALARKVTLKFHSEPGTPWVRGDKVHLSQVVINLVLNAMDAVADMPPGRRHVSVRAHAAEPGWVELEIRDSGSGIPPHALEQVFEPFYTTKATGIGIGLPVSRTIVDAHGGRIWAENEPGGGAVFRVRLPVA
jgi:signal transduction histidine kinase